MKLAQKSIGLLALLLLGGCLTGCGSGEDDDFSYETSSAGAVLVKYKGSATSLTLPATYNNQPVVEIGTSAFAKSVLQSIDLSACTSLHVIGQTAFLGCADLTEVKFPAAQQSSLTEIQDYAFASCTALTSITLPSSLATLGKTPFIYCDHLVSFDFDGTSLAYSVSSDKTLLLNGEGSEVIMPAPGATSITVPNTVKAIAEGGFSSCETLLSVQLPEGLTSIGDFAFQEDCLLRQISLPSTLTSLGKFAFYACDALTHFDFAGNSTYVPSSDKTLILGDQQKSISAVAWGLSSLTIPSTVTSIEEAGFIACKSLTRVTSAGGLLSIGERAFGSCEALQSVILSSPLKSIGTRAFRQCGVLSEIQLPTTLSDLDNLAFEDCIALSSFDFLGNSTYEISEDKTLILTDRGTTIFLVAPGARSVSVPNTVPYIYPGVFTNNGSRDHLESITLSASVKGIGEEAFFDCAALTSITLPDSLVFIGTSAFYDCQSLQKIYLPISVQRIDAGAFEECSSLSISCGASAKPAGWANYWNPDKRPVSWGVSR